MQVKVEHIEGPTRATHHQVSCVGIHRECVLLTYYTCALYLSLSLYLTFAPLVVCSRLVAAGAKAKAASAHWVHANFRPENLRKWRVEQVEYLLPILRDAVKWQSAIYGED